MERDQKYTCIATAYAQPIYIALLIGKLCTPKQWPIEIFNARMIDKQPRGREREREGERERAVCEKAGKSEKWGESKHCEGEQCV